MGKCCTNLQYSIKPLSFILFCFVLNCFKNFLHIVAKKGDLFQDEKNDLLQTSKITGHTFLQEMSLVAKLCYKSVMPSPNLRGATCSWSWSQKHPKYRFIFICQNVAKVGLLMVTETISPLTFYDACKLLIFMWLDQQGGLGSLKTHVL